MNKTKQRSDEHFNHLQKGQITQINLNTKYDCNFIVYYVFRLSKKEKVYCWQPFLRSIYVIFSDKRG